MTDEFDTDKGIKDDYDGVVKEAYYQVGEQGDTNLVLMVLADDGEEVEARYRIGADWASFDGGVTIEHPTKTKIRADSQIASLVERAMQSGAEAVIRQRSSANESKGPRTSKLWPGLKFHWDVAEKPYDFKNRETGEEVKGITYKSYPTKFLGEQEVGDGVSSGESAASTPSAEDTVPPEVIAKLKVLAQSHPFAEWVDEALTIDYVRVNMLPALGDESFYNSLKG